MVRWLDDYLSAADHDFADEIVATVDVPRDRRPEMPYDIWSAAKYRVLIANRVTDFSQASELWDVYLADLRNAALTFSGATNLIAAHGWAVTPLAVARNGLYPIPYAFMQAARSAGFALAYVDGGVHSRRVTSSVWVAPSPRELFDTAGLPVEASAVDQAMSDDSLQVLADHLEDLQFGRSLRGYSSEGSALDATTIRTRLSIRADVPVVTLLTSSQDEVAAGTLLGALPDRVRETVTHDEWLEGTLASWDSSCPVLVVRVHPRLAGSRSSRQLAEQAEKILSLVSKFQGRNIIVDLPRTKTPLRHLVAVSSACLNYQSTAGLEFLAQGVPVFHEFPEACCAYSPELLGLSRDWREMASPTDAAFDFLSSTSGQSTLRALRWWSGLVTSSSVPLWQDTQSSLTGPKLNQSARSKLSRQTRFAALAALRRSERLESIARSQRNRRVIKSAQARWEVLDPTEIRGLLRSRLNNRSSDEVAVKLTHEVALFSGEAEALRNYVNRVSRWHPRRRTGLGAVAQFLDWSLG